MRKMTYLSQNKSKILFNTIRSNNKFKNKATDEAVIPNQVKRVVSL